MAEHRFLRMADIEEVTSLSKATIYRYIKQGDFPKQIKLGPRRVGWREVDVLTWMAGLDDSDRTGVDHFTVIARKLAEGTLKGQIILGGIRQVRMLRIDERVLIERTEESG